MRLSEDELTAGIDDDFRAVLDDLRKTFAYLVGNVQKGRATHTYGTVAHGEATCIVPTGFPTNASFRAGQVFPVVLRHSSPGGRADDRARDGAGAAIKFFEPGGSINGDGILDVLMNAGRQFFVRSLRDFATFVHTPDAQRIELVRQGIMREPELIEAYRVRGSYTEFHYHSWVCFAFDDNAGVVRYLRYRLISHDRGPDRGVPRADFQANGRPSMEPWPDDPRPPDFMRQDFAHRVRHGEVRYILQAQFRDAPEPHDANHDLFDPSQRWDEVTYPWLDMFDIRLTAMVEDPAAIAALAMNPNRSPACIRIPLVTSPDQFASLCQGRAILYPGARAARAALTTPESH